jgi:hypothetical protein
MSKSFPTASSEAFKAAAPLERLAIIKTLLDDKQNLAAYGFDPTTLTRSMIDAIFELARKQ